MRATHAPPTTGRPAPPPGAADAAHVAGLDALRVLAVLLVTLFHIHGVASYGVYGVVIFFVLSGFLITSLLLKELQQSGTIHRGRFWWRRALRVQPAATAYLALYCGMLLLRHRPVPWEHALAALLYVGNFYILLGAHAVNPVSHFWTLAVDVQYYLLWPFVVAAIWRHRTTGMRLLLLAIGLIWVERAVLGWGMGVGIVYLYYASETRLDALFVGSCLAFALAAPTSRLRARHWPAWAPVATMAAATLVALGDHLPIPKYREVVAFALLPPVVALLILQLGALASHGAWRWLEHPVVRYLGRLSYSMYLYQAIVLAPVMRLLGRFPLLVQGTAALAATIAVAALSYHLVEQPALRWRERWRPRAPAAVAA